MNPVLEIEISKEEHLKVLNSRDIDGDFIRIGAVSGHMGRQSQYLAHYIEGIGGVPSFSSGLRIKNSIPDSYHSYEIHRDDIKTFIKRIREYESRAR